MGYHYLTHLIILDELTSALDPISEEGIYTNFNRVVDDKRVIYISHRLSSCKFCDSIAVFGEGCLLQLGAHEQLLKDQNGE